MLKWTFVVLMMLAGISASASNSFIEPLSYPESYDPSSLLNWKVGDASDYTVSVAVFGKVGTIHKEVTKEEGNGFWMTQKIVATGHNESSEVLIDRDTGKVLKFIHNGKEETYPEDQPEIISQEYTEVTVPAGTFKAMHIVAKSKQAKSLEIWENMKEVVIDGSIKQVMDTQYGKVTIVLNEQHRAP